MRGGRGLVDGIGNRGSASILRGTGGTMKSGEKGDGGWKKGKKEGKPNLETERKNSAGHERTIINS